MGWRSTTRLLPQLTLAAAGALVLSFLSNHLPRGSELRAKNQLALHEKAFETAARSLDVVGARYQESQLEILAPERIDTYRGHLKKAELLYSLFTRPGQLHTQQGLANLVAQVGDVEAALGAEDPDVTIAKAYVLWQVGGTRDDEYEAAMLCARALRHAGSPLLAPLARNYIAMFLDDPYAPHDPEAPSLAELARLAEMAPGTGETTQFDRVIEFDRLIKDLDRASTAAYLDMLAAHADLRVALASQPRGTESPQVRTARNARTAAAQKLIEAWAAFDRSLESSMTLPSDVMVLSVFTLDDAVLVRARYWATVPSANDLAPMLTSQPTPKSLAPALPPALRAQIAPLRVAWEARYAPMLGPNERDIVAYQEAKRFAAFEQRAVAFETAYIDFLVAVRTGADPTKLAELASRAATSASGMGLYRDTQTGRIDEASHILATAHERGQQASSDVRATIAHNYQVRRLRFL
jgi:hypothetical protein